MKLISFGELSFDNIYIVISSLSYVARDFMFYNEDIPVLSYLFLMSIGEALCGILEIVSNHLQKNFEKSSGKINIEVYKKGKHSEEMLILRNSYNINNLSYSMKCIFIILLISIIDAVAYLLSTATSLSPEIEDFTTSFKIIFKIIEFVCSCVLSRIFLKYHLYKHHILSICMNIIGLIICVVGNREKGFPFKFLLYAFGITLFSPQAIIQKYLTDKKYMSIFLIISVQGMFEIAITFILAEIFNSNYHSKFCSSVYIHEICVEKYSLMFSKIVEGWNILRSLGFILTTMAYNIFIFIVIKKFSPTSAVLSDTLALIIGFCLHWGAAGKEKSFLILAKNVIGYLIILFFSMVYNEIIVLGCFGMEEMTKKLIRERAIKDLDIISNSNSFIEPIDRLTFENNESKENGGTSELVNV